MIPMLLAAQDATSHAATGDFWSLAFVFVLSSFIGLGVIRRVSRLLHTPLMSGANSIHGIVIIGAMLIAAAAVPAFMHFFGVFMQVHFEARRYDQAKTAALEASAKEASELKAKVALAADLAAKGRPGRKPKQQADAPMGGDAGADSVPEAGDDLGAVLRPRALTIVADWKARGGFTSRITAEWRAGRQRRA